MDEAVAGHASRIEVTLEPGQPADRRRQRPRHPGRPAPQISGQVGARGDPHHAPFGRQVRGQGLFDLGRPARRRRQRRQRAVDRDDRRSRARARSSTARASPRASPTSPLEEVGAAPNRRGTTVSLHPRSGDLRRGREVQARRGSTSSPAPRPICSPGSRSAGAAIRRWSRDDVPEQAVFQFPGGLADHLNEQVGDRECVTTPPFAGRQDFPDGQGSAEWAVAWPLWSEGANESYYCNTIPTPDGGTHEAGPARRADQGHPRLRRAGRPEEGQGHHPPTTWSTASS